MTVVAERLSQTTLGEAQTHANLTIYPLLGESPKASNYELLDRALAKKWVRITELTESGSVPELKFANESDYTILLLDGEELVGAKQNRILNLTILAPPHKTIVIPVSCVEAGRWRTESREFRSAERAHYAQGRARKVAQVSESLRYAGVRHSDQSEIWADISEKAARLGARSETGAAAAMYEKHRSSLRSYVETFSVVELQAGAVFAINGKVVGLDLFDSSQAFEGLLPKLVQSYALDALDVLQPVTEVPSAGDIKAFMTEVAMAEIERFPAVGAGEDLRLTGDRLAGGALELDGQVLHLCAFRLADASDSTAGRRARASVRRATRH